MTCLLASTIKAWKQLAKISTKQPSALIRVANLTHFLPGSNRVQGTMTNYGTSIAWAAEEALNCHKWLQHKAGPCSNRSEVKIARPLESLRLNCHCGELPVSLFEAVSGAKPFDVAACDQASRTLVRKVATLTRRVGTEHIIAMPSGCFELVDDCPECKKKIVLS